MPQKKIPIVCPECKRKFLRAPSDIERAIRNSGMWTCKACCLSKRNKANARPIGSKRVIKRTGYVEVKAVNGWVREHQLIMEAYLGRKLSDGEVPHHMDEDRSNNTIENLELMLHGPHTKLHHVGVKRSLSVCVNISKSRRKLSDETIADIRQRYETGEGGYRTLGRLFGVAHTTIKRAVLNLYTRRASCQE